MNRRSLLRGLAAGIAAAGLRLGLPLGVPATITAPRQYPTFPEIPLISTPRQGVHWLAGHRSGNQP
jgi:hypothetical protein